ncbi:hypothetical protein WH47_09887 [Habropoda laboriosa]|uniref:Uncharacterized protein n=1 Tax=Habropoda laboriosa TaxID=597456 RepID=A0A0L7R389_9HYME|nr:hypothetical protein WH47_09887 [Habropoda laboriosa]
MFWLIASYFSILFVVFFFFQSDILYSLICDFTEAEKLKTNERRASGLMAYPRIGRSNLMAFPRIGRSDLATSNLNFNRRHDMEPEPDFQLYNSDFDSAPDKDYEDPRNPDPGFPGRSMNLKHTDKIPKEIERLIQDLSRSKDYRPWQKINEARFPYSNSLLLTRGTKRKDTSFFLFFFLSHNLLVIRRSESLKRSLSVEPYIIQDSLHRHLFFFLYRKNSMFELFWKYLKIRSLNYYENN